MRTNGIYYRGRIDTYFYDSTGVNLFFSKTLTSYYERYLRVCFYSF